MLVHPNRGIIKADAETLGRDFQIDLPIVLDNQLSIAKRAGVEVTPEAIVIQRGIATPVYRGAIDNQYAGFGKKRLAASKRYLIDALDNILANEPVLVPATKPVGCFISWDSPRDDDLVLAVHSKTDARIGNLMRAFFAMVISELNVAERRRAP